MDYFGSISYLSATIIAFNTLRDIAYVRFQEILSQGFRYLVEMQGTTI